MNEKQNNWSSYTNILEFRAELNNIEQKIQTTLRERICYVGISIQLMEEEQDGNTPTRGQKADINDYCDRIQKEDNCEKCNLFDIQAKQYSLSKNDNDKCILVNCHAGVTNLIIPYSPEKDKYDYVGPVFYIFIGHFLLINGPNYEKRIKNNIEVFDRSKILEDENVNYNLIKKFTDIDNASENKYTESEDEKIITRSNFQDLESILEGKIIEEFEKYLFSDENPLLNKDVNTKIIKPSERFRAYIDRVETTIIKQNLKLTKETVLRYNSIRKEDKVIIFNSIEKLLIKNNEAHCKIVEKIDKAKKEIESNPELNNYSLSKYLLEKEKGKEIGEEIDKVYKDYGLPELQNWSKEYSTGRIGNRTWFNAIKKIDDTFSYTPRIRTCLSFLFDKESKIYEYTGILFFAVAGNFLYQLISKNNFDLSAIIGFLLFALIGNFVYFFSYRLGLVERDYFRETKEIIVKRKKYIYRRLGFYKLYLLIPILLMFALIPWKLSDYSNFKTNNNIHYQSDTHFSKQDYSNWCSVYDAISIKKKHYIYQYELVDNYINTFMQDSIRIYDIAAGTGDLYNNLIKNNKSNTYYASDGSKDMIKYAKIKHRLKENDIFLKDWQTLNDTIEKYDLVLLLGNSIASIENKLERDKIINNILSILKTNGRLLVDFDFKMKDGNNDRYTIVVNGDEYIVDYVTEVNGDKIIETYNLESIQQPKKKIKPRIFTYSSDFSDSLYVNKYFGVRGKFISISKPKGYRFSVFELTK
jgi:SAM-dependent methyltransferase